MNKKAHEELKQALHKADVTELDEARLEEVAGGACNESCYEGCSQCCSSGSANRGGGIEIEAQLQRPSTAQL